MRSLRNITVNILYSYLNFCQALTIVIFIDHKNILKLTMSIPNHYAHVAA